MSYLLRGQPIYIDSAAVSWHVDLPVEHHRDIEFIVEEENVPLIAVPQQAQEIVPLAVGVELRRIVGTQHTLHRGGVGVTVERGQSPYNAGVRRVSVTRK